MSDIDARSEENNRREIEFVDRMIVKLGVGRRAMPFDLGHLSFRSREVRFRDLIPSGGFDVNWLVEGGLAGRETCSPIEHPARHRGVEYHVGKVSVMTSIVHFHFDYTWKTPFC